MRERIEDLGRLLEIANRLLCNPLFDICPDDDGKFDKDNRQIYEYINEVYGELLRVMEIAGNGETEKLYGDVDDAI